MSNVALIVVAIVLVPVVVGAITGGVMNPRGWKETLNAAAVGSGIVAALVVVAIVAAMIAHPTECTGSSCAMKEVERIKGESTERLLAKDARGTSCTVSILGYASANEDRGVGPLESGEEVEVPKGSRKKAGKNAR